MTQPRATARAPRRAAGIPALQRTAGNAAVAQWVQRTATPQEQYADRPTEHPEWGPYQELVRAAGIPQQEADDAWQLLLGGVAEQGPLNAEAMAKTSVRQEQRELRATNTWYRTFTALMGKYLEIDRPTMALWSGGLDLSDYAYAKGHMPLERTRIGGVLNVIRLNRNWALTTPMWNILSKEFVSRANGPVHIFMRAFNPESVLISQEVPQLHVVKELNPQVRLRWHPVYTDPDGKLREIAPDFTLTDNAEYDGRDKCVTVLIEYLRKFHDESNTQSARAHEETEKLLAGNGNKP
ncbi:hypothetical protein [Streptomyces sp. NPDC050504]|uniref:hypothetical protein n=1 Tax=Streptomyces sp. NPDC050504 TaxID=3365618 RepID=UPI0037A4739D